MGMYVALLRGINVGGHHKLPMKKLAPMFEKHGAHRVATYIQSGNVVFEAKAALAKRIPQLVADSIAKDLGFTVPILTRSSADFRRVAANHPFSTSNLDPKTLHVAFLSAKPKPVAVASLDPERSPEDRFDVSGREVFLHYPNGSGRTKLTYAYLEKKLGVSATVRNWRTCSKLALMLV